jgi:hypothetical protein
LCAGRRDSEASPSNLQHGGQRIPTAVEEVAMGVVKRARTAEQWADLLVQELSENLKQHWAEQLARDLSVELCEELDEDFHEDMPSLPAKQLAEELAEELRQGLLQELQGDLPQQVRQILHAELEELLFAQLTSGHSTDTIRQLAIEREEELAEKWARWVAGELTSHLLERLADRMEEPGD